MGCSSKIKIHAKEYTVGTKVGFCLKGGPEFPKMIKIQNLSGPTLIYLSGNLQKSEGTLPQFWASFGVETYFLPTVLLPGVLSEMFKIVIIHTLTHDPWIPRRKSLSYSQLLECSSDQESEIK